jgi:hypothetical protein
MLNVTLSRLVYLYNEGKGDDDGTSEKALW